ncbi:hypothetical protein IWQ60_009553 [Tieghemiomyces parasiticus]|uniref:J domain-containing protein n=1 Tax=Tieghemiomyces parasiticus TaxID=78921 RepID=A0A9W7ZP03_9FUNG|nr:hypothetical protein IWQ60_009553 [Tieghemiomyces parasiticus]
MSSVNMWASLVGWAFLPDLVTNFLQSQYYKLWYEPASTPRPGESRHREHRRWFYTLVIATYLAYTVTQTMVSLPPNYYKTLAVAPSAFRPKELRSHFRKLSLQHHPDKTAVTLDNTTNDHEGHMIHLRNAYEALNDPIQRFGYELVGNEYRECSQCTTAGDYLHRARSNLIGSAIGSGIVLVIFHFINRNQFGRALRVLGVLALATFELYLLTHASVPLPNSHPAVTDGPLFVGGQSPVSPAPALLHALRGWFGLTTLTLFELSIVLHQLYWTFVMALSQLGPVWFPSHDEQHRQLLQQCRVLSEAVLRETTRLFLGSFAPFRDPQPRAELCREMGNLAVESLILRDPKLAEALDKAYQRLDSPTGEPTADRGQNS